MRGWRPGRVRRARCVPPNSPYSTRTTAAGCLTTSTGPATCRVSQLTPGIAPELLRTLRLLRIMRLGGVTQMTRQAIGQIRPGDVDPDVANRAARRIRDFLAADQGLDRQRV